MESCDSQCMKNFVPYHPFHCFFLFQLMQQKNDKLKSGDNGLSTVNNVCVHPCM